MNHEEQNSVLLVLIRQIKSELKEDISNIDRKLSVLQDEYDAVLQVQREMLATQRAVKRIVKWASGIITLLIGAFQLAQLILAMV